MKKEMIISYTPVSASEETLRDRISKVIQTTGVAFLGLTAIGASLAPALLR